MSRLREMEVFLEVADAGSFAAGARRLRLSPPAVTRLIAALEDRLGTRLVQRTTRSMQLTEAGERFRRSAQQVLADLDTAEREAAGEAAAPRGRLVVTAPSSFGRMVVTPVLAQFLEKHPDVTASLLLLDRVVNLVDEGIDVGVRIGELPDSRLVARRVGAVTRPLVASPRYLAASPPLQSPEDLRTLAFIAFTGLMPTRTLTFEGPSGPQQVTLSPRLEINDAASAIAMAEAGFGITLALSYMVREQLEEGRLVEVLGAFALPVRPVQIIYPETRLLASRVRAFIDFVAPTLSSTLAPPGAR